MNGVNLYLKHEEAKNKFKMIFNEDAENYQFAGADHVNLVAEYGLHLGDLKRSVSMVDLHLKIQENFALSGVNLDDDKIRDIIISAIR